MESQQNSIWNFFRWGIYHSPEELFDILIFEKFPIATIDDEVDTVSYN
jgi:hypothetical protein